MELPDLKALKKLAKACRDSGIHTFKGQGIEFTLTHEAPLAIPRRKRSHAPTIAANEVHTEFSSDTLTPESLLFWSSSEGSPQEGSDT